MGNQWTKQFPTAADDGKWFFVKQEFPGEEFPHLDFNEVRLDGRGELYLCKPCNDGIAAQSFGTPLRAYNMAYTSFFGPVEMPPDLPEIRNRYYSSNYHKQCLGKI